MTEQPQQAQPPEGEQSTPVSPQAEPLVEARVSVPDAETGRRIAEALVEQGDAACVQVLGPMASIYLWKGEVHRANEFLMLVKTTEAAFPRVIDGVLRHHSYDVPEIIAVPVTSALDAYADWVVASCRGRGVDQTQEPAG